jgi:hypothetical protein
MAQVGKDVEHARGLTYDTFCAGCGYNLRTRPRVGRCPECGNEYDTRPLHLRGLLGMDAKAFPLIGLRDVVLALLVVAPFLVVGLEGHVWGYYVAGAFALIAAYLGIVFVRGAVRWGRYSALMRQARREQNEKDE